jgi:transcription antitermination factor NusG
VPGLAPAAELAGVVSALPSNLAPVAVPDEDIVTIRRLIDSGLFVEPHTPALGERVTITAGALAGISGVIVRVGRARLVVNVENLHGRAIAVELDAATLRSVETSARNSHGF